MSSASGSTSSKFYKLCSPHGLDHFLRNWLPISLFSILIITYEMVVLVNAMMPSSVAEEVLDESFFLETGFHVNETAYIGAIIFVHSHLNWELLLGQGSFVAFISIFGGIIVTLAVKIGKALKGSSIESETMAKNQKKIFILLIFQVLNRANEKSLSAIPPTTFQHNPPPDRRPLDLLPSSD